MRGRDNHDWVRDLGGNGSEREAALSDLRTQLLDRLRRAWAGNPCADDALLEDAVQNSLIQILSKLGSYLGRARFMTWATTIAVHAVVTEMRRRRWSDVTLESAIGPNGSQYAPTDLSLSPAVQSARGEVLGLLNSLIRDELTERQRIVLLAELQGMPLEEIARRLGTNRNAIYKLAHDARRSLKAKLKAKGYVADEIADLWTNPQGGRTQ
ncbi:MAG: sigma-70 family RNA polymerase sigma factor [Pirellulales bacterium]|nr:sigma-70 family RNA polymerase sigma factor [Pirellulales bacterium]